MEGLRGSFKLMKQLNISMVLELIRKQGPISRSEIAELTKLTPATISNISKELLNIDFIKETSLGESTGGRPPVMLELNPEAAFVIGINLGPGNIEGVITNIEGKIIRKTVVKLGRVEAQVVVDTIKAIIKEIISDVAIPKEKIIGIGMAVHGIVNSQTGVSEYAPFYDWKHLPLKEMIEKEFDIPVLIDNDVNAMALAESWFGIAKSIPNFVTIFVGNGVGSGVIIQNSTYYGVSYSAGEVGHIVVENNGPLCSCGNHGCLESLICDTSMLAKYQKLVKDGKIKEEQNINSLTISNVYKSAKDGNIEAVHLVEEAGKYLGIAIANLVNILNPTLVVIAGEITQASDLLIKEVKATVNRFALKTIAENTIIMPSALENNAASLGAVSLILKDFFKGKSL